ncbi:MAG: hypothetical protein GX605_12940 [Chloroflexi bacterium]|nr:hypothetical protein [Chloroflexota bacterium]
MSLISRLLMLVAWVGATLLVFCLYMIARFFQQKSDQRSHYVWFLLPLVLYLVAALYYTLPGNDFAVNPVADLVFCAAGLTTLLLGNHLLRLMTGGRR